jgi:hypothetical protein
LKDLLRVEIETGKVHASEEYLSNSLRKDSNKPLHERVLGGVLNVGSKLQGKKTSL